MISKKVESLQHPFVKHCRSVRLERGYREEKGELLLLGRKEVLSYGKEVEALITLEGEVQIPAKARYLVSEKVFERISGMKSFDGYAALVPLPRPKDLKGKKRLLVLDQLQDPGNVGTLLRSALGLGWEGVVVTPGTADLFNDKALRAAKGASLALPYQRMTPSELLTLFREKGFAAYTADTEGRAVEEVALKEPIALILSREGEGPLPWTAKTERITIPMSGEVESLNVAASGAILLYLLRHS